MTALAPLAVGPDPMLAPRVHEVLEVIPEIPGVITLRGAPVDGDPPPFLPAQVSMVGAFGVGEAAISISSPVTESAFQEWTIRRAGAITSALTTLRPGEQFWTRGPFGRPWDLDLAGRDVVIVAGGIGLAPLRSAVYAVLDRIAAFRSVTLVVGARTSSQFLFAAQYDEWGDAGIDVRLTIDRPEPGWHAAVGFVHQCVSELDLVAADTSVLLCGPDIMMRLTADVLVDRGVDPDQIQLTLERNMQCGNGLCGHCQLGPLLVCRDGPVVRYPVVRAAMAVEEL